MLSRIRSPYGISINKNYQSNIWNKILEMYVYANLFQEWEDGKILNTGTYFVLMTSIFVNVYIISAIGDRLKEEVHFTIFILDNS